MSFLRTRARVSTESDISLSVVFPLHRTECRLPSCTNPELGGTRAPNRDIRTWLSTKLITISSTYSSSKPHCPSLRFKESPSSYCLALHFGFPSPKDVSSIRNLYYQLEQSTSCFRALRRNRNQYFLRSNNSEYLNHLRVLYFHVFVVV
jgi:hypothetical protein